MFELRKLQQMGYSFTTTPTGIVYQHDGQTPCDSSIAANFINTLRSHKVLVAGIITGRIPVYDSSAPSIAIDLETTDLNPRKGQIRYISTCRGQRGEGAEDPKKFSAILFDPSILKIFHNAVFDVSWLETKGFRVNNFTDTMLMSIILNQNIRQENSLAALALKYLNITLDKQFQHADHWQGPLTDDHIRYAIRDAEVTYELYPILMEQIERRYLHEVLQREVKALPAVVKLSTAGILFDFDGWREELDNTAHNNAMLETEIRSILGNPSININSSQQLQLALRSINVLVPNVSDEALARFENQHPVIGLLRKYKKTQKQISAFGQKLKDRIETDGRIYGNWHSIGTATGRMTCTNPNLQGMPGSSKAYFKAAPGHVYIVADYSQIELRVLAQLSQDPVLLKSFSANEDLHTKTAAMILGKDPMKISPEERKIAKTANFGLIFGMTSYGLQKRIQAQYGITLSLDEAAAFRNGFFEIYRDVLSFQDAMLKTDCIRTLGGRYWSTQTTSLKPGSITRLNYPIQGTAAEGFKEALALLTPQMQRNWLLVAAVHDEIVLEVPHSDIGNASEVLSASMTEGMSRLIKNVPIVVDLTVSDIWKK